MTYGVTGARAREMLCGEDNRTDKESGGGKSNKIRVRRVKRLTDTSKGK